MRQFIAGENALSQGENGFVAGTKMAIAAQSGHDR
jgi:hypothetical protein